MNKQIRVLLNIKPTEVPLVKQLFLVQFFLGFATSILFVSSLTIFLSHFAGKELPQAYIGAAILLLLANIFYSQLEKRYLPHKLLLIIILFSVSSIFITWLGATFLSLVWLPFFLSAWNLVVYMLAGYAFWGMAAIIFNVRESKRLFTVVGAGDMPAKMLGYVTVAILAPVMALPNLLLISIAAFLLAYYFLQSSGAITNQIASSPEHHTHAPKNSGNFLIIFLKRLFEHRLIFFISLWSVVAFTIYAFIDFTFSIEIKARYSSQAQLATFIGFFFVIGRFVALLIKLFLSSRLITRVGLANSLLVSPILLLGITAYILVRGDTLESHLYVFGIMVLISEILKSIVQEPVFFVLFQPLNPHLRLKGHLIAKGYTLPFALAGSGLFLTYYLNRHEHIPIALIAQIISLLLIIWIFAVLLIKKAYLSTLIKAIQKGYFTGTELFLNQDPVRELLLEKTKSSNANEAIYALDLLERSDYTKIKSLWLSLFLKAPDQVKFFITDRIIANNTQEALPLVEHLLQNEPTPSLKNNLIKAYYFLLKETAKEPVITFTSLNKSEKKAAMVGMLSQSGELTRGFAEKELEKLTGSPQLEDKILALSIIEKAPIGQFTRLLQNLLTHSESAVVKKAIVAVGKTKDYDLLPVVIQLVQELNLYPAFQNALLAAGDEIFKNYDFTQNNISGELTKTLIKTAGKIKGENSDNYLHQLLSQNYAYPGLIIEALWFKKTELPVAKLKPLEDCLISKFNQTHLKIYYYQSITVNSAKLLKVALKSEIELDLQKILKAFALLYNRRAVDRVIHLYRFGNPASFSNAVEMLENIIPKSLFAKIDIIFEFLLDIKSTQVADKNAKKIRLENIITDILIQNKVNCNTWTKSVAYYILPDLEPRTFYQDLVDKPDRFTATEPLIEETRNYVKNIMA